MAAVTAVQKKIMDHMWKAGQDEKNCKAAKGIVETLLLPFMSMDRDELNKHVDNACGIACAQFVLMSDTLLKVESIESLKTSRSERFDRIWSLGMNRR